MSQDDDLSDEMERIRKELGWDTTVEPSDFLGPDGQAALTQLSNWSDERQGNPLAAFGEIAVYGDAVAEHPQRRRAALRALRDVLLGLPKLAKLVGPDGYRVIANHSAEMQVRAIRERALASHRGERLVDFIVHGTEGFPDELRLAALRALMTGADRQAQQGFADTFVPFTADLPRRQQCLRDLRAVGRLLEDHEKRFRCRLHRAVHLLLGRAEPPAGLTLGQATYRIREAWKGHPLSAYADLVPQDLVAFRNAIVHEGQPQWDGEALVFRDSRMPGVEHRFTVEAARDLLERLVVDLGPLIGALPSAPMFIVADEVGEHLAEQMVTVLETVAERPAEYEAAVLEQFRPLLDDDPGTNHSI